MFSFWDMIFCFQSGFQWICSCTVLVAASALTLFRHPERACLQTSRVTYNVYLLDRWTFTKFSMVLRVWKFENKIFHNLEGQSQPHWFYLTPHSMLMVWQTRANCLGASTWRDSSPKTPSLQPSRLIVSTFGQHESCNRTYGSTM